MKHSKLFMLAMCLILTGVTSCLKPRVELDQGAWGDNAFITNAVLFEYVEVTNDLGYDTPVTGYQSKNIGTTSNVVDRDNATITIIAQKGTNLTKVGVRFSHYGTKIEPLDGAPVAGVISDFSKGYFKYKVYSADGTIREWKLMISVAQ
ncbi:DUF5018-related domain-containing protein [Sphingobacterium detergens]